MPDPEQGAPGEPLGQDWVPGLMRLAAFYERHDLGRAKLWNLLWGSVVGAFAHENVNIDAEAVRHALSICAYSIVWDVGGFGAPVNPDAENPQELSNRVNRYFEVLSILLRDERTNSLNEHAFMCTWMMLRACSRRTIGPDGRFEPSDAIIEDLKGYLRRRVFVVRAEGEMNEQEQLEDLRRRRQHLAAYVGLCTQTVPPSTKRVISISNLEIVLRNCVHFHDEYGDISKVALVKAKHVSPTKCAITMVKAMFSFFGRLNRDATGCVNWRSQRFVSLKKQLSKRFASGFGTETPKEREAAVDFHRRGIRLAVSPRKNPQDSLSPTPNLAFLVILLEFVSKLGKQDRAGIRTYLEQTIRPRPPTNEFDDWEAYDIYR